MYISIPTNDYISTIDKPITRFLSNVKKKTQNCKDLKLGNKNFVLPLEYLPHYIVTSKSISIDDLSNEIERSVIFLKVFFIFSCLSK